MVRVRVRGRVRVRVKDRVRVRVFQSCLVCSRGFLKFLFSYC